MHYTDPQTGLFHVGFLHDGAAGATTDDLVTYHDLNTDGAPFIVSGGINDPIAVFDGSVIPNGLNNTPTLLYTSVSFLPIQWTINYTRGSETQSLAVFTGGGSNTTKLPQGPVIPDHPFALNVTGFRDPYVFQSAQLDDLTRGENGAWYTVISGGVHGSGPSEFLYKQTDPEFQYWEYLGQWWHEPANSTYGGNGKWAGRWGFNFEVANYASLDEQGYSSHGDHFTTLGAEWSDTPIVPQVSDFREMLWAFGNVSVSNMTGNPKFTPSMAGKLDWGHSAYAAAGKILPSDSQASKKSGAPNRFISYLWLTGNFYGTLPFPVNQQNWSSTLLMPRELSVGYVHDVVDNALAREVGSWRTVANDTNAKTVTLATLKQVIVREALETMQSNATTVITEPAQASLSTSRTFTRSPSSKHYLLQANITIPSAARNEEDLRIGFSIFSSEQETTDIYWSPYSELFTIDRSKSSAAAATTGKGIDVRNEEGRLRLFDIRGKDGYEQIETMEWTILVDGGVVEVHINGRFAMSTWVW